MKQSLRRILPLALVAGGGCYESTEAQDAGTDSGDAADADPADTSVSPSGGSEASGGGSSGPSDSTDTAADDDDSGDDPEPPGMVPRLDCETADTPETIDCFYERILDGGIENVADAIPLLPSGMRENLFIMEESRSRHQATTEFPRGVMYMPDARFIVSFSSVPTDSLYEVFEMIEQRNDGTYKFRQLDMRTTPPTLSTDDTACQACHGERVRPIWGEYPVWPGLLERYEEDNAEYVERIPERFGSLGGSSWFGEDFNYHHGPSHERFLMNIVKSSPAYDTQMRYELAADLCEMDGVPALETAMRALGITKVDARPGLLSLEISPDDWTAMGYYAGDRYGQSILHNHAVMDLMFEDRDEELQAIMQPVLDHAQVAIDQATYDAYGGWLFKLRTGYFDEGPGGFIGPELHGYGGLWGLYPYGEEEYQVGSSHHQAFCAYVASKLQ